MSKGLRSWVRANWVDIANPKKGGGFPKCGRSNGEKKHFCHDGRDGSCFDKYCHIKKEAQCQDTMEKR